MKKTTTALLGALAGLWLMASAPAAMAHDHDRDRWENRHEDRGWHNGQHHRHYRERDYAVYQPYYQPYYAPPPPPVVYQPAPVYYGYRQPALTIGISPIVIPLR